MSEAPLLVAIGLGAVLTALAVVIAAVAPAGAVIALLNDFHLMGQWSPYSTLIAGPDLPRTRLSLENRPWPPASS